MPFEEFYEKSDKERQRHWKSLFSTFALLAVVLISLLGLYSIFKDRISGYLKESARIKRVEVLCAELPKPYPFNFVERKEPVNYNNNSATEIVYRYQTERSPDIIIPKFIQWFRANRWERRSESELIFTKGEQTIALKSADNFFTHYDIHCYEEGISFGIYDLSH